MIQEKTIRPPEQFPWSRHEQWLEISGNFPDDALETLAMIAREICPQVSSMMLWECRSPWQVEERRLCDNLFIFVIDGVERITVGDETRELCRGDIALIPEFVPHRLAIAPGCARCRHFIAHILSEAMSVNNPFTGFAGPFFRGDFPEMLVSDLLMIAELARKNSDLAAAFMTETIKSLMVAECRKGRFSLPGNRSRDARIYKALEFMRENLQRDLSIAEIAASVQLGEVRFRALFKAEFGLSPSSYLLRLRVSRAAGEMIRHNCGLKEASFRCGFTNISYFCVAFRRVMGMTPSEYRKNFYDWNARGVPSEKLSAAAISSSRCPR